MYRNLPSFQDETLVKGFLGKKNPWFLGEKTPKIKKIIEFVTQNFQNFITMWNLAPKK
jgi:hypothetical protein